ncbi:hypothetical protein OPKNFCMD_3583 [Methylobacterium crusticola]|uniref:Glycosyltransferase n=1 Tax=Methylobacterium crusticola TaxID=1697972 RepID=A0ABQ4QZI9_9HYPH|nr:glycosyltransferase family 2 protein [Methylobacterium crusticola]GJD50835.1 hypothetical protein OPKNFCMD_3583 [Methylobacterium crusticola]
MLLMDLVFCGLALAGAVPVLVFLAQMLASRPPVRPRPVPAHPRPSLAVLIPAHDEGRIIAGTVAGLMPELAAADRLVVVADNCRDTTAAAARAAGAEVVERDDPARRGKGFALDHGLRYLERTGLPEVVVVIDADCAMQAGGIDRLARLSAATDGPVQGAYRLTAPPRASSSHRIAAFATLVKQVGRPLGWSRLGQPCALSGTGFAVPARHLAAASLASSHLTEDLKLGMDLALAGHPARFCPQAEVTSVLPEGDAARRSQQTRWEHGHLALILPYASALVGGAWRRRDPRLLGLALDLCVPPLVVLTLAEAGLGLAALAWWWAGGGLAPLLVAGPAVLLLGLALAVAIGRWGRGLIAWRDALALPGFAVGKVAILLQFLVKPQAEWVRAERRTGGGAEPPAG